MPLYEYECQQCHRHTEKIQKFSDPEITECPHCGGKLERVISAPAIAFKGGGWYADGYGNKKSGGAGEGKAGEGKSGESKAGETKSGESKSDSGAAKAAESSGSSSKDSAGSSGSISTTASAPSAPASPAANSGTK